MVSMENIMVSMETMPGERRASSLEVHLGYWLRRVSNHVSGAFARALQTRQTSVAEWVVLCHVQERPGITPGELAEALALTRGAVSKVIDKLEGKNWITGSTKPEDNRVRLFSLTRRGSRVLPELAEIADRNDQTSFDALEAGERATLRRLLAKLVDYHQIGAVPIE
jgi:DNA-binding MarR family transcriptional regulator